MTLQLRNCEFAYQCEAKWEKLGETDDQAIRFCDQCQKEVHRCVTDDELLRAIRSNLCVAIEPPYPLKASVERTMLVGSMRVRPLNP
jgi:hypothetical protein